MKTIKKRLFKGFARGLLVLCFFPVLVSAALPPLDPEHGPLIWSDEFNTIDENVWTFEDGDGCEQNICGWGNGQLEWDSPDNARIEVVPGEPGNNALVIESRREFKSGKAFTSVRMKSEDKLAIRFGMVEVRARVPDVSGGLWPAIWLLGANTLAWPAQGEIDMMEMGFRAEERERQGHVDVDINQYSTANIFNYDEASCSPENATCAAMFAWEPETTRHYVAEESLADRFVLYRLYWTPEKIVLRIKDGENPEHDFFAQEYTITGDPNHEIFLQPFYLLLNNAVGGSVPGILAPEDIFAELPAKMYIDYVRVYEYEGFGEVIQGRVAKPESGIFGVFTESADVSNTSLSGDIDSSVLVWGNTLTEGAELPYEGEFGLSWLASANSWFGGGIAASVARDLSAYVSGTLNFHIKVPNELVFRIGILDTKGGENWISSDELESNHGLVRSAEWSQVSIPIHTLRGGAPNNPSVDLAWIHYPFAILSVDGNLPSVETEIAIDNIYWSPQGGVDTTDSDGDGVIDEDDFCHTTQADARVDSTGCVVLPEQGVFGVFTDLRPTQNSLIGLNSDVWVWGETLGVGTTEPLEGENGLAWSAKANHWFGAGVEAKEFIDLSLYASGALNFSIKIPADVAFQIGITDIHGSENWIEFPANLTTYGLIRNGEWGQASIPVHYLRGENTAGPIVDISSIKYAFAILSVDGGLPSEAFQIGVDDIYWDIDGGVSVVDDDSDGVINIDDACPETLKGSRVTSDGCPIQPETGVFGVFTETEQVNNSLSGLNSNVWVWDETLAPCVDTAYEGDAAICWSGTANQWFGAGVNAVDPIDLSNFENGQLRFHIKVAPALNFRIGILDTHGFQHWVDFPANEPVFGLMRSGEWEEVTIPISVLRGAVALNSIAYPFAFMSIDGEFSISEFTVSIDNIYWDGAQVNDADNDGINDTNDKCPMTPDAEVIDGQGCSASQDPPGQSSSSAGSSSSSSAGSNSSDSSGSSSSSRGGFVFGGSVGIYWMLGLILAVLAIFKRRVSAHNSTGRGRCLPFSFSIRVSNPNRFFIPLKQSTQLINILKTVLLIVTFSSFIINCGGTSSESSSSSASSSSSSSSSSSTSSSTSGSLGDGTELPCLDAELESGYCLVWQDEFNGSSLDLDKWSFEYNCYGGGNEEQQCYFDRSENAWVGEDYLHITALKQNARGPALHDDDPSYNRNDTRSAKSYTSSRIRTRHKGDWKYGRFEMRAKLPFGQGTWPAFWMMPTDDVYGGWASSGEIDIMEAVNLKVQDENHVHGTLHFGDDWPKNVSAGVEYALPNNLNPADDFHIYALEWEEGEMRWYVDGDHYATQTDPGWYSMADLENSLAPFDQRFHIILNLAVGGAWSGNTHDASLYPNGVNPDIFPQAFLIDYVRVYQCERDRQTGAGCASTDEEFTHHVGVQPPILLNPEVSPYILFDNAILAPFEWGTWSGSGLINHETVLLNDEHAQVEQFTFETDEGIAFIGIHGETNLMAYTSLEFDIRILEDPRADKGNLVFRADCTHPCSSGDFDIGYPSDWTRVSFALSDLAEAGLDLERVSSPVVVSPAWGNQQGVVFQIDNVQILK